MTDEWVTAAEAIRLTAQLYEDETEYSALRLAERAILKRAAAGILKSYARVYEFCVEWDDPPERQERVALPASFWSRLSREREVNSSLLSEDWRAGDFSYSGASFFDRASETAFGVVFKKRDLPGNELGALALEPVAAISLPLNDAPVQVEPPKSTKGGRPPQWEWERALAVLVAQANWADGLPEEEMSNASAIARRLEAIFTDMQGDAPTESELRRRGSMVVTAIAENPDPRRLRQLAAPNGKQNAASPSCSFSPPRRLMRPGGRRRTWQKFFSFQLRAPARH